MTALLPIVLLVHIGLALALLVPAVLLPFTLRRRATVGTPEPGRLVSGLMSLQGRGTVIGLGLLASGLILLAVLGFGLLGQPWLLVALGVYALNLGLAFFIQRPGLRRLFGIGEGVPPERTADDAWTTLARRQRYLSYLMAGLVGTIGFLMSTKPKLW